jgi:hypothetical protein
MEWNRTEWNDLAAIIRCVGRRSWGRIRKPIVLFVWPVSKDGSPLVNVLLKCGPFHYRWLHTAGPTSPYLHQHDCSRYIEMFF